MYKTDGITKTVFTDALGSNPNAPLLLGYLGLDYNDFGGYIDLFLNSPNFIHVLHYNEPNDKAFGCSAFTELTNHEEEGIKVSILAVPQEIEEHCKELYEQGLQQVGQLDPILRFKEMIKEAFKELPSVAYARAMGIQQEAMNEAIRHANTPEILGADGTAVNSEDVAGMINPRSAEENGPVTLSEPVPGVTPEDALKSIADDLKIKELQKTIIT